MAHSMKMANNEQPGTIYIILQFIRDCLPMVGGIIAIWKIIHEIAKWWSTKQDVKIKALIANEVKPQIDNLTDAINGLREEIGRLKK